ncbi:hypothetical protein Pcinc_039203 [Petrolisthes cinctipes]|uniref:Uncharacterized protein n=1 Tax=Petrolisthes cinctipes TaxID=88211 RepID=A0AAE1EKT2_PETCI|nr:hypothetical protein Pcinc_039203 [Petrolisthes cinctipes]
MSRRRKKKEEEKGGHEDRRQGKVKERKEKKGRVEEEEEKGGDEDRRRDSKAFLPFSPSLLYRFKSLSALSSLPALFSLSLLYRLKRLLARSCPLSIPTATSFSSTPACTLTTTTHSPAPRLRVISDFILLVPTSASVSHLHLVICTCNLFF